jgi:SagB-type dehydrogenase family enzyme
MDLSLVLSLPEEVSVCSDGESDLTFSGPAARFTLRQPLPATRCALQHLAHPGASAGQLVSCVQESCAPGGAAHFFHYLRCLAARGLLVVSANAGDQRLASLVPAASKFQLPRQAVSDRPYILSRFAYLHREEGYLVIESPLSAAFLILHDHRAAALTCAFTASGTLADVGRRIGDLSTQEVASLVALLVNASVLAEVDDSGTSAEDHRPSLQLWEFHDLLFHSRSRVGRHNRPLGNTYPAGGKVEPPPALKSIAALETCDLYRPDLDRLQEHDPPLARVMERRRSIREYAPEPITAQQLGEFLYRVARVTETREDELVTPYGPVRMEVSLRPYPTAGALSELEVYVVVQDCNGLKPGLYHYDPLDHRLAAVTRWTDDTQQLMYGAGYAMGVTAEHLQVLLVLTARFQRLSWKYSSLAYSLILKDVGVVFQNMYLAATAMELAPCALGAGDSDVFARAVGSDYYAETSVGEFLLGSKPRSHPQKKSP